MMTLPLILDGATGTALQKRGMPAGACTEQWVLDHPEAIKDVQSGYLAAGSQVLYAPTFGANRVKLEQHHIVGQTADYNARLLALTRETAGGTALVGADLAPTGLFVKPYGDTEFETLVEVYAEQAKALAEAGADLFVIETTMTLAEARAAVLAVRSVSDKPIFVTFTCDETGRSLSGTDMAAALVVMQRMGVTAFGLNCSTGPEEMLHQLRRIAPYATVPLIAKPNAGLPEVVDGQTIYHCPPEEFVAHVPALAEAGVRIFGGCCGTDETHIAALRRAVDAVNFGALPQPERAAGLFCATERRLIELTDDDEHSGVIACGEDLEDDLMDAEEEIVCVAVESAEDVQSFAESCFAAPNSAMCILSHSKQALEQALRVYQGIALTPADGFEPEFLQEMQDRYGVVLLEA
jgi:5-methyltetrahydrofolate--homocysteine methyltransferase